MLGFELNLARYPRSADAHAGLAAVRKEQCNLGKEQVDMI